MSVVELPCQKCGHVWKWVANKSPADAVCPKGFGCSKVTKQENWNELENQIKRFRSFKERTGADKSSSYSVSINFTSYDDSVYVELGGYNVGDWSRHEKLETTLDNLVEDFTKKIDEADELTKNEAYCPYCKDYTMIDDNGKCVGNYDWNDCIGCEGQNDEC